MASSGPCLRGRKKLTVDSIDKGSHIRLSLWDTTRRCRQQRRDMLPPAGVATSHRPVPAPVHQRPIVGDPPLVMEGNADQLDGTDDERLASTGRAERRLPIQGLCCYVQGEASCTFATRPATSACSVADAGVTQYG